MKIAELILLDGHYSKFNELFDFRLIEKHRRIPFVSKLKPRFLII